MTTTKTTTTSKRRIPGRQSVQQRRRAREARQLAAAPPAPPTPQGELVEITGSAKVDVHDPIAGHVRTDHKGAVGVLEDTYYSPERRQHMARVRVGMRADGSGGQPRGIPLERLRGVGDKQAAERVAAIGGNTRTTSVRVAYKPGQYKTVFGHDEPDLNLMSNADRRASGIAQDPDLPDYQPTLAETVFDPQ
ncbi:MAG: hypothetical protein Q8Q14_09160 [Gemmatimonadales bacterium]|nr:hypothetical protein [Gemmatimonadales bacterium]